MWLPLVHPRLGIWPTTQTCALTGNQTGDPLVPRPMLHPLSHSSQGFRDTILAAENLLRVLFFKHWIRLEIFPDVLVHRLKMTVDPADSSYMPSLVVVSGSAFVHSETLVCHTTKPAGLIPSPPPSLLGGNSLNNLIELKTININSTDTTVPLLSDCAEVSRYGGAPW